MTNRYKAAGVNIQAGYDVVKKIKKRFNELNNDATNIGNFGGMFNFLKDNYNEPILVSGTDGVGTKLLVAINENKHDTIGIDCVAMCVNDIVAQGATPLFFMDYLASGKTNPDRIDEIISGVIKGCVESDMVLLGGETAEMPGMYSKNHYDIAGFAVGVVEKSKLIDGKNISAGDKLIGITSSGLHSNGYSLVRKILFEEHRLNNDKELIKNILAPTKIYVSDMKKLIAEKLIVGAAHITGGGFYENIPRMLPKTLMAKIKNNSWPQQDIFNRLQKLGNLTTEDMFNTFNMGIGMVLAVKKENINKTLDLLNEKEEQAYVIGEVTSKRNLDVELVD